MANPQIRAVVRALNELTERVVVKITLDTTANLVKATPVDIGWARANWVPSIGTAVVKDLGGLSPTSQDVAAAGATQQEATVGVAAGYKLAAGRVFISNNVPYILKLNDGSSQKAPAGFVERAIQKAVTEDIRGFS